MLYRQQTIQRETEIEIASLKSGEPARRRPLKHRKLDAKIKPCNNGVGS